MDNTMIVVVATSNQHKLEELQALVSSHGLDVDLQSMQQLGVSVNVEETGTSFEENAYIKAKTIFDLTGVPTLADDSGLEVDALDGRPGVYSARFSGPHATDASNRNHLRAELAERLLTTSSARFRCILCYVDEYRTLFGEGACEGTVQTHDAGEHGFGYDPQFVPAGFDKTFAQLGSEAKQSMSHRALAVTHLSAQLNRLLNSEPPVVPSIDMTELVVSAAIAAARNDQAAIARWTKLASSSETLRLALYETLLQSYLFGGFPTALDALTTFSAVNGELQTSSPPTADVHNNEVFYKRGRELCARVYGSVYPKMMDRLSAITPDLSNWMILEGYGKTLSRPGLSTILRELAIVAMLANYKREQQLISHVRGAQNVGATAAQLETCYALVYEQCSESSARLLRDTINRFAQVST